MSIKYNGKTIAGGYVPKVSSELEHGIIRIATNEEVRQGRSNDVAITPKQLNDFGGKANLFDTKVLDYILPYEKSEGWALQGTYVYKTAILNERYGYPTFIEECIKQKKQSIPSEVTLDDSVITMYIHDNGHIFYDISDKDVVDAWFETYGIADFYGIDVESECVFLPRNNYFMQLTTDTSKVNNFNEAGLPSISHTHTFSATTSSAGAHTHNITLGYAAGSKWGRKGAKWGGDDVTDSNTATGTTASAGAHTHTVSGTTGGANIISNIYGTSDTVQPPSSNKLLYYCVGNTISDTSWIDTVTQTANGVQEIEDKRASSLEDIETARLNAVTNIEADRANAITNIETDRLNALAEIDNETTSGVQEINNIKAQAIIDFDNSASKYDALFGMPIGYIGLSPFPVDEAKGLQRILNGQIILQSTYKEFTKWLKDNIKLYPQSACTEEEWQTTVTMSTFGQCGKFVIDDEAGTIRLPKITGFIQGLTDLASLGELVEAGLPSISHTHTRGTMNIKGGFYVWGSAYGTSGVFSAADVGENTGTRYYDSSAERTSVSFDASKNWTGATSTNSDVSALYGKSTTVQPEAIRYPYFIQVATAIEEQVEVVREVQFNNPFFFGYYQYFNVTPDNASWLKSEGQWNNKEVYPDYYNWILENVNNEVSNFKLTTDTYDEYCWVINLVDNTFRLPIVTYNTNSSVNELGLYFYVGEALQNVKLMNVGRIEETLAKKVDISSIRYDSSTSTLYIGV